MKNKILVFVIAALALLALPLVAQYFGQGWVRILALSLLYVLLALGGSFLESFRFLNTVKVKQGFMVFSALWLVLLAGAFVF